MKKRTPQRINVAFNASYAAADTGMLLPCCIIDISWGGSRIELFAKHTVVVGSTIELHIELPGLNRRIVALFRCLWIRPVDRTGNEKGNLIGGSFIDICPEDRNLLMDHAKRQIQKGPASSPNASKHCIPTYPECV